MPYTLTYSEGILRVDLVGALTGEDLLRLDEEIRQVRGLGGVPPNRVTDATAATLGPVGFNEVFAVVERRRERAAEAPARHAVVVVTPLQKGFARMAQTLSASLGTTVRIFDDLPAALAWAKGDAPES